MHRYAVVALTVVNSDPFSITGDLATNLSPGVGAPLDLVLTNPHDFDLRITALSVSVRGATTNPGCSGEAGYGVAQFAGTYPVVLAPGSSRLSALVPDSSLWPQVSMRNLPTNQDACKGAVITLDYSGLATR
ncbi:MAG: hypothetical protein QOI73_2433 [Solirubrobacteraceae bacterium]|nr:hypothetical protein [Solirubrobacteraceae bacterium]